VTAATQIVETRAQKGLLLDDDWKPLCDYPYSDAAFDDCGDSLNYTLAVR